MIPSQDLFYSHDRLALITQVTREYFVMDNFGSCYQVSTWEYPYGYDGFDYDNPF